MLTKPTTQKRSAAFLNGDTVKLACLSHLLTDYSEIVGSINPAILSHHINQAFQQYLENRPVELQTEALRVFGTLHAINTMLATHADFALDNGSEISDELNVLIG